MILNLQEEMEQRKILFKNSIKVLNERKEILYSRRLNDDPTTGGFE